MRAAIGLVVAICVVVTGPAAFGRAQGEANADDEAVAALVQATQEPRAALPFAHGRVGIRAELSLRGISAGARIRTRVLVQTDINTGALRVEPLQSPPSFVFVVNEAFKGMNAAGDLDGTFILPRGDSTVQREDSRELLRALLGVPLSAAELLWAMTGCPVMNGTITGYWLRQPNSMRVMLGETLPVELVVRRPQVDKRWSLHSMSRGLSGSSLRWRIDYGRPARDHLRHFRIRSQEWNGELGRTFDVSFSWDRIELGAAFDDRVFAPDAHSPQPVQ